MTVERVLSENDKLKTEDSELQKRPANDTGETESQSGSKNEEAHDVQDHKIEDGGETSNNLGINDSPSTEANGDTNGRTEGDDVVEPDVKISSSSRADEPNSAGSKERSGDEDEPMEDAPASEAETERMDNGDTHTSLDEDFSRGEEEESEGEEEKAKDDGEDERDGSIRADDHKYRNEANDDDDQEELDESTASKKRKVSEDDRNIKKRRIEELEGRKDTDTGASEVADAPKLGEEEEEEPEADGEEQEKQRERKEAITLLTEIEVDFAKVRDILHDDKMTRYVAEIEMCADGTHPELTTVAEQIQKIRNEKLRLAKNSFDYQRRCIDNQTRAARYQLHQQCIKDKAEARAGLLTSTTEEWYRVNKERRAMDQMVPDYGYTIAESRGDQIRQRQAVFDEISVLTGLSKHIGFPAAPQVAPMREDEIHDDLRELGILR